jgi:putative DNA primase/helicase
MAQGSTEAGIRQILKNNAKPIIFDEAEAEAQIDKQRIQHVLELVRASTSEGGAAIVKGTQSQTGAKRYTMRSCFMFLSINVTINNLADESRVTVLALESPRMGDSSGQEKYDALMGKIAQIITPEYCAGFVARSVRLMPVIRDNAATFAKAVAAKFGSSRIGDQIGTLCAGAYSLYCGERITLAQARKWIDHQDWSDATAADAETDEQQLMNRLLLKRVNVRPGVDRTVGELIAAAAGRDEEVTKGKAGDLLKQNGLIYQRENTNEKKLCGVWVANKHLSLAEHLKDTPWASSWSRALRRHPGAQSSEAQLYFSGVYQRAIFVPIRLPDG